MISRGKALSSSFELDLFWLSALHMRIYCIRWCEKKGGNYFCRFVFVVLLYNTNFMNKFRFKGFLIITKKKIICTVHGMYKFSIIYKMTPLST